MCFSADAEYAAARGSGDGFTRKGGEFLGTDGGGDGRGAGHFAGGHADRAAGVSRWGEGSDHDLDCFERGGEEEYSSS